MESSQQTNVPTAMDSPDSDVNKLSRNEQVLIEALSEIEQKCEQANQSIAEVHSMVNNLSVQLSEIRKKNEGLEKQVAGYHRKHRFAIVGLIIIAITPALLRAKTILWP